MVVPGFRQRSPPKHQQGKQGIVRYDVIRSALVRGGRLRNPATREAALGAR